MSRRIWTLHRATSYPGGGQPGAESHRDGRTVALPSRRVLDLGLDEARERRGSCRRFSKKPLALDVVSTLLDAGYGCGPFVDVEGIEFASRPVPSAGAKYPLQLHLVARAVSGLRPGSYQFLPEESSLARSGSEVKFSALAEIFLRQPYLVHAAAVLVVSGRFEQTASRYGDRGYRYVLFEAGHVAQNVALTAAALDIGCLSLGGFLDDALAGTLGLEAGVAPLYGAALGHPASEDRGALRQADDW